MNNATQFLSKLELQKQADKLLKDSYNTDESSIAHLLNNKSQRHATGKLAEYKKLLSTCKFKLTVYFKVDKWNREFTIEQKKNNEHRRFIPSNDLRQQKINHEVAFNELLDYCLQNANRIDAAQIYLIDKINGEELLVFKFDARNVVASDYRHMEFKTNEYGHRYFDKMIDAPIRIDKIRS